MEDLGHDRAPQNHAIDRIAKIDEFLTPVENLPLPDRRVGGEDLVGPALDAPGQRRDLVIG
jgi:hypothetical protein